MLNQNCVDKKFVIKICVLGLLVIFILCILQILDYSLVHPVNIKDIAAEGQIEWQIDMIKVDSHYIAITGWAFVPGQEPENLSIGVVLQNVSTKDTLELPNTIVVRDDINDHYVDEIDYSKSGFLSRVNRILLDLDKESYNIYLKFVRHDQSVFIKTTQVLSSQGD